MNDLAFRVAEILVHNKDYFRHSMALEYIKTKSMDKKDAIPFIEDTLMLKIAENTKFSPAEIEEAFCDERVKIVISKCFTREFQYEH